MLFSITEAEARLDDLVNLAEAGNEVILTRHGKPAVRLMSVRARPDRDRRRAVLEKLLHAGAGKALPGESAARSQDFLYDEDGLPK